METKQKFKKDGFLARVFLNVLKHYLKYKKEDLADTIHGIMSRWIRYEFYDYIENEDGTLTIPEVKVKSWKRQLAPYIELSEKEKNKIRSKADMIIEAILNN